MLRGYHTEFLETESTPLQLVRAATAYAATNRRWLVAQAEDIEYLKVLHNSSSQAVVYGASSYSRCAASSYSRCSAQILESGHDILTVDVHSTGREVNRYEDYLFVKETIEEEQGQNLDKDHQIRTKYSIPSQKHGNDDL